MTVKNESWPKLLNLPPDVHERLAEVAHRLGVSQSSVAAEAIRAVPMPKKKSTKPVDDSI